ncbi:MAG: hypothetical protein ACPGVN_04915 [Alphaproteobacteria bacterium]
MYSNLKRYAGVSVIVMGSMMAMTSSANAATAFPDILSNIATVTVGTGYEDSNPKNNTGQADLSFESDIAFKISKTDKSETYTPGEKGQYVIEIANSGATNAVATIGDQLPEGVTILGNIACTATGDAVCGKISEGGVEGSTNFTMVGATVPGSGKGSISIVVDVMFASNMTAPEVVNVAAVSDPQSGVKAEAKDDVADKYAPKSDLAIVKRPIDTDTYTPGGTASYELVITNAGPSDAFGATIADLLPAGATLAEAWTCTADDLGSACSEGSGGNAGDQSIKSQIDVVNGGTVTVIVPVQFSSDRTQYEDSKGGVKSETKSQTIQPARAEAKSQ